MRRNENPVGRVHVTGCEMEKQWMVLCKREDCSVFFSFVDGP